MSRKLFVGGAADGKWIETNDKDFVRIAQKSNRSGFDDIFAQMFREFAATQTVTHAYQIQRWHADGERFEIFAPEGQPPSDTFQLLIRNYKP